MNCTCVERNRKPCCRLDGWRAEGPGKHFTAAQVEKIVSALSRACRKSLDGGLTRKADLQ